MDATTLAIAKQVSILEEIAQRQEEELTEKRSERDIIQDAARKRSAVASAATDAEIKLQSEKKELDAQIRVEQMEVERLLAELKVWREDGKAGSRKGGDSLTMSMVSSWQPGSYPRGEKQQLEGAILAARKRLEDISEHLASRDARKAVTSSTRQEGLLPGHAALEHLQTRLNHVRRELIEEEDRARRGIPFQDDLESRAVADELAIVEHDLAVEDDLQQTQQAQLRSVEASCEPLRLQLQQLRRRVPP